jgi:hypothetical protein
MLVVLKRLHGGFRQCIDFPMVTGPCPAFVFSMNSDLERLIGYTREQVHHSHSLPSPLSNVCWLYE